MTGKLTILLGAARSGKSTYAQKWQATPDNTNKVIINSDQIRLSLHGNRYVHLAEPFVFAINEVMVRCLYNQGYHLLIDETNCSQGSIRKWLSIDINAEAIYIKATKEECFARALATEQSDLIDKGVIDRHFANLISLCEYALGKDQEESFKISSSVYSKIFDSPDREYILKAVEYIRKEIKNEKGLL